MKVISQIVMGLSLVLFSFGVVRAETPSSAAEKFWLFLGSDAGYLYVNANEANAERNKDGYQINVYGLGSYDFGPVVADLGMGWLYQTFEGKSATAGFGDEKITTRAFTADAGVRWVPFSHFQIGPKFQTQFATDLSYRARVQTGTDLVFFGGLQAVYEFDLMENLKLRTVAQFMTDLSVSQVQVFVAQGGIQLGFSPVKLFSKTQQSALVGNLPAPPPPPPAPVSAQPETSSESVKAEEPPPQLVVTLESEAFRFESNSARLNATSRRRLVAMGKFLGENPDAWGRLRIDGHTDQMGTLEYNQTLSEKRAEVVRESLIAGGAPSEKLVSRGYSSTRPLNPAKTPEALSQNRRVELGFDEVVDPASFQRELETLKKVE